MAMTMQSSGSIKNFCMIGYYGTQPASGSLVLTLRKNKADSATVITVPAGGSVSPPVPYCDTTHTLTFQSGDLLDVQIRNNATATAAEILGYYGQILIN